MEPYKSPSANLEETGPHFTFRTFIGYLLLGCIYPILSYVFLLILVYLFVPGQLDNLVRFSPFVSFLLSALLSIGIAKIIKIKYLMAFGMISGMDGILYWYVIRPIQYNISNVISDSNALYLLIFSATIPVILAVGMKLFENKSS